MNRQLSFLSLSLLFISSWVHSHGTMVMSPGAFQAPSDLRLSAVLHDEEGFHVLQDNIVRRVDNHDIDAKLRNASPEQLQAFLKVGYLSVNKLSDGNYKIGAKVRGLGGGPVLAMLFYGSTKGVIYGATAAASVAGLTAAGAAIGGTFGGQVGAEVGGSVGGLIAAGSGLVASGTPIIVGSATTAGTLAAGAVGGSAVATTAATTAAGAAIAVTGGSAVGYHAATEIAAVAMWHIGMWIPWF